VTRLARPARQSGYLVKQILLIQNALRVAPVMHGLIKDMNRDEMLAVATYLASLGGQP
jgi:cytochrome c553